MREGCPTDPCGHGCPEAALRGQAQAAAEAQAAGSRGPASSVPESRLLRRPRQELGWKQSPCRQKRRHLRRRPRVAARPVVAVRGDDRPGMKRDAPAAPGRPGDPEIAVMRVPAVTLRATGAFWGTSSGT